MPGHSSDRRRNAGFPAQSCGASYMEGRALSALTSESRVRVQSQACTPQSWGTWGQVRVGGEPTGEPSGRGARRTSPSLPTRPGAPACDRRLSTLHVLLLSLSSTWFQGPCPTLTSADPDRRPGPQLLCSPVSYPAPLIPALAEALDARAD